MFFPSVAPDRSIGFSVAREALVCRQSHEFSQFPVKVLPCPANDVVIGGMLRVGISGE